jgi:hypothetical protein
LDGYILEYVAIVEVALTIEFDAKGTTSLESILGIQADHGPFDGHYAPIEPTVENVVFETPVYHQIGTGWKRAQLRREPLGQGSPRNDQAVRLLVLDEGVEIRESLAEVKWQFQLEQAEPNLIRGHHVARFHFEIEIVKVYRSPERKYFQNCALAASRNTSRWAGLFPLRTTCRASSASLIL